MRTLFITIAACFGLASWAQYHAPGYNDTPVNIPTEHLEKNTPDTAVKREYSKYNSGFWFSIEATGGYSANVSSKMDNIPFAEMDTYAGYRFNEFVRVGLGIGGRYYFGDEGMVRRSSCRWAMPIMFNVRGNIIHQDYRTVVPYYSLDIGGTINDGFLLRPTIGIRCGEPRSAFLLGVSYMLQNTQGWDPNSSDLLNPVEKTHPTSFFALRIGYEF